MANDSKELLEWLGVSNSALCEKCGIWHKQFDT